jgi:hypothetical protein
MAARLSGVEPDGCDVEAEALHLAVEPAEIDDRVMHVGRRREAVGAVERRRQIVDEGKVDHPVDLAKQMVLRNQLIQRHNLERGLFRGGSLQHDPVNQ